VHGTGVYSAGVGSKGPALERFLNIKKSVQFDFSLVIGNLFLFPGFNF
jgi:hypothetical protein